MNTVTVTADVVRAWGRDHGFTVGQRGHLSTDLIKAYNRAMRGRKRFVSKNPCGRKMAHLLVAA